MRSATCGAAVGAALAVVLTGCGSGTPKAKVPSPLPITASSTGTASVGTPTPTLDPNSDAAVIAAVKDYVAAFQVAGRTGNSAQFISVTAPTCGCREGVSSLVGQLKSAQQHTDVTLNARDISIVSKSNLRVRVAFTLTNSPYHVFDASGRLIGDAPAAEHRDDISFELRGRQWIAYLSE